MNEHVPQLSMWPVLVGLAVLLIVVGLLALWVIAVLGVALLLYSLWGWAQENRMMEHMHVETEEELHE